jgi:hypothetical protein
MLQVVLTVQFIYFLCFITQLKKTLFQVQPHFQSEIVPQYDEKTFTMCLFSGLQAALPYLSTISRLVLPANSVPVQRFMRMRILLLHEQTIDCSI